MDLAVWNIILSAGIGLLGWFGRTMWGEVQRLSILLNRTREEVARDYVTRADVHADINRVIARIDNLDAKIDRLLQGMSK
jgi:hypothetical protein